MFIDVPNRKRVHHHWAAPLLTALNVGVFLALVWLPSSTQRQLIDWFALVPHDVFPENMASMTWLEVLYQPWWTLFSALFLHLDWLHLLGNVAFLLIFGMSAERSLGGKRFILIYLLCGALANVVACVFSTLPATPIIGASGAVSGIIGAYITLFPRAKLGFVLPLGLFLEFVRTPAVVMIGVWLVMQAIFTYIGPNFGMVAWIAHLAGFFFGVLAAFFSHHAVQKRMRSIR